MMVMTTLDKSEHEALRKAPGSSDRQRLRFLVKFWQAVCNEKATREKAEADAEAKKEADAAASIKATRAELRVV